MIIINHPNTATPTMAGEVRFSGAWAYGITGTVKLGEVEFEAVGVPGRTTTLDITAEVWADTNGQRLPAADNIPDGMDGSISVRQPLPTPTPTFTPMPTFERSKGLAVQPTILKRLSRVKPMSSKTCIRP